MFQFKSYNDEELSKARGILQPGEYKFYCAGAENSVSKNGNPMLSLELKIWDESGAMHWVRDWLVDTVKMAHKTKKFLDSIGKPQLYHLGTIDPGSLIGSTGMVKTRIRKSDDGQYENAVVHEYLTTGAIAVQNSNTANNSMDTSDMSELGDVPF